jgi:hypothetical protein
MSRHPQLYAWADCLGTRLPSLNPALATVLALWSIGMILTRRCGLDSVTVQLTGLLGQSFDTVRQRLREFYQEASAKRGRNRTDFPVAGCFAPLLAWVLSFWSAKRLALALDVTNLGSRFHVLCVSALYGGIGIPVAWKILTGNRPDAWHPHWCALLGHLQGAVPADWQVVVLSDRGLESARLFEAITALGWHPLMRAKGGGKFRPEGWHRWYGLSELAKHAGVRYAWAGRAYQGAPLACTLLACWDRGHAEPWLLLTDLPVAACQPCWYAWRAWVEQGFKVTKRGGLNWQNTRMTRPGRAERLFLAIAVTTLWLVAVGAEIEHGAARETVGPLPSPAEPAATPAPCRRLRLFVQGLTAVVAALVRGVTLPRGTLFQETWPEASPMQSPTEDDFHHTCDLQL